MARATVAGLTPLTKAQSLRLIDAWPCPVRIARDLDCPDCGWAELGQTFLIVTHDARMASLATRRVHMHGGLVVDPALV